MNSRHRFCPHEISEEIMIKLSRNILRNEAGATAIEYGLIAALVSIAAIGALTAMGSSLDTMFSSVANELETAVN